MNSAICPRALYVRHSVQVIGLGQGWPASPSTETSRFSASQVYVHEPSEVRSPAASYVGVTVPMAVMRFADVCHDRILSPGRRTHITEGVMWLPADALLAPKCHRGQVRRLSQNDMCQANITISPGFAFTSSFGLVLLRPHPPRSGLIPVWTTSSRRRNGLAEHCS
jgi:hypothetical protein